MSSPWLRPTDHHGLVEDHSPGIVPTTLRAIQGRPTYRSNNRSYHRLRIEPDEPEIRGVLRGGGNTGDRSQRDGGESGGFVHLLDKARRVLVQVEL